MMYFISFFLLLFPGSARAYLDPGTGGMLLQLVMAGGAGVFVLVKIFLVKIKQKFIKRNNKEVR